MPVYVCAESALQHYRSALSPAPESASARITSLGDASSLRKDVDLLNLTGLGLSSPSVEEPLWVLVPPEAIRGRSKSVRAIVWGGVLPERAFRKVQDDAYVSSPEFLFLQMATKLDLIALIELGMELCGTYRRASLGDETQYDCPSLTTPRKIRGFLDRAGSAHGAKKARQAAKYLLPNSASPLETIVYLLLCLPRRLGGYALPRPKLNVDIRLGKRGQQHTLRKTSIPDLFWRDANLDLECHGKVHELAERRYEDSMRRKALERMKVEVVELTYEEIKDSELFRATVQRLAKSLGVRLRPRNEYGFLKHEEELRNQLLFSGQDEQKLWNEDELGSETFESWEGEELPSEFDSWEVYMADGDAPEL